MGALDRLRRFAATRNGKLALGGGALATVVGAGLVTRLKTGGGDPAASSSSAAQPFTIQGTAPAGGGIAGALDPMSSGIDAGAFEDLVVEVGRLADAADEKAAYTDEMFIRDAYQAAPRGYRSATDEEVGIWLARLKQGTVTGRDQAKAWINEGLGQDADRAAGLRK